MLKAKLTQNRQRFGIVNRQENELIITSRKKKESLKTKYFRNRMTTAITAA
jgi:hypothetical protein